MDLHRYAENLEDKATCFKWQIAAEQLWLAAKKVQLLLKQAFLEEKFDPNQPRVLAGNPTGGQWTYVAGYAKSRARQDFDAFLRGRSSASSFEDVRRAREGEVVETNLRRGGSGDRISARFPNSTPAQQIRLAAQELRAQMALQRVRELDPNYKPRPSLTAPQGQNIEGAIRRAEAEAREAEARLLQLNTETVSSPKWTSHGTKRVGEREISDSEIREAIRSAENSGDITTKYGKYNTPQFTYKGSNGVTVIVESSGRNAGKIITLYRHKAE